MRKFFYILLATTLILSSCGKTQEPVEDEMVLGEDELYVFLADGDNSSLVEYCIEVDKTNLGKQITSVISVLKEGVDDEGLKPTIPENLLVDAVNLEGSNVILHVGEGFDTMDQVDFILCRSSLIKSLTAIDGVDSIEFYLDGYPMKDAKGKVYGSFYGDDVVTSTMTIETSQESQQIILYFPDDQGQHLVRVDREITINSNVSIEYQIVEALKEAPTGYGLTSALPIEAEVKSIEVSDGICYIDFNEAFKAKHYGGATGEIMTVYSIVNSLTELPNISQVQFLIEGVKTDNFKGHLDFGALFENDINLISKEVQVID